ncbi:MAG: HD domain-containing protein [Desulfamplus sp.]|nr:HD domain-containing protein [Desulfamplus sp.]
MTLNNLNEQARWMKDILNKREREYLSPLAAFSESAIRRKYDSRAEDGYRQNFSIDADRILHSLAYTRYIDKTQVFSLIQNDHLTHRVLHVQLVSRIARTIGRYLGLNEDLIEAASMGHDLGHPPFGHDGERILSELTSQNGIGYFHHNIQSIQILEHIEQKGKGLNLSLQTLDAIVCHNGEIHSTYLKPDRKRIFEEFDNIIFDMSQAEKSSAIPVNDISSVHSPQLTGNSISTTDLMPMTMEGCVVRASDTIAYIGRDIEDSIRVGLIKRDELPLKCVRLLGNTNGTIVYNLVTDLIANSLRQPYIAFSSEISDALKDLKAFNYERIYGNPAIKKHLDLVQKIYVHHFNSFLNELESSNRDSTPCQKFLNGLSENYRKSRSNVEIVRDFISGMTDSFFISLAPQPLQPSPILV